jgi:periplasmic divalent cation tolerance protein
MNADHCLVALVTAPAEVADELASGLVRERLAACVNIVPGVSSVYRWEGRVEKDAESLMVVKTQAPLQRQVVEWVHAHHPYTTPEIIFLPIIGGSPAYLAWLASACTPAPGLGRGSQEARV